MLYLYVPMRNHAYCIIYRSCYGTRFLVVHVVIQYNLRKLTLSGSGGGMDVTNTDIYIISEHVE